MTQAFDFATLFAHAETILKRKAGETIFRQGEEGKYMFVVKSGEIHIKVGDKVVEKVGPGGIIGEMAMLDNSARSAGALAATDCEVVPIDLRRFLFLLQQTPFFAVEVMRVMVRRLRAMNLRI